MKKLLLASLLVVSSNSFAKTITCVFDDAGVEKLVFSKFDESNSTLTYYGDIQEVRSNVKLVKGQLVEGVSKIIATFEQTSVNESNVSDNYIGLLGKCLTK